MKTRILRSLYITHFALLLCSSFCSTLSIAAPAKTTHQTLDHIVVIVNDTPITNTELNDTVNSTKQQIIASNLALPPDAVLRKQILQQLIDKKLQLQLAEQMGLKVDNAKVNEVIQRIAKENGFHSAQALYAEIKHRGMTEADYREEIHQELLLQTLQQNQVGAKITITPQEIKDFMRTKSWETPDNKEYHIQNILLSLPDNPSTQQIQDIQHRANTLLDAIHQAILAQTKSPRSNKIETIAAHYGLQMSDLGWRKLSEVPSAFAESVQHMQTGDVVGPIQTSNGFHILYLAEARSTTKIQNVTTQQIEQWIYQRKMEKALQQWIIKLRAEASIQKEES